MSWWPAIVEVFSLVVLAFLAMPLVAAVERVGASMFGATPAQSSWLFRRGIANFLKLLTKEEFIPSHAGRRLYVLAPLLAFALAFAGLAFLPILPPINLEDAQTKSLVIESDYGLYWWLVLFSASAAASALAGWASNNKTSLLGGLRSLSRFVAVQVGLALSVAALVLVSASARLDYVAADQSGHFFWLLPRWNLFTQPIGAFVFLCCGLALCARAPFDVAENSDELVDYRAEYGAIKFALFVVADRIRLFSFSILVAVAFLGGHRLPWLPGGEGAEGAFDAWSSGLLGGLLLLLKTLLVLFFTVWIRWSWPRLRYEDLILFGWRRLIPAAVINLIIVTALVSAEAL